MGWFEIVPIFIVAVVFAIVLGKIAYRAVAGLAEWSRNNSMPVQDAAARVVARRTEFYGRTSSHSHGRVSTYYFATFEMKSGERSEFSLSGPQYGLLAEGDEGTLTYQGTRYLGFKRRA